MRPPSKPIAHVPMPIKLAHLVSALDGVQIFPRSQEEWRFHQIIYKEVLAWFPVRVSEAGKITHYSFIDIHFTLQMTWDGSDRMS